MKNSSDINSPLKLRWSK